HDYAGASSALLKAGLLDEGLSVRGFAAEQEQAALAQQKEQETQRYRQGMAFTQNLASLPLDQRADWAAQNWQHSGADMPFEQYLQTEGLDGFSDAGIAQDLAEFRAALGEGPPGPAEGKVVNDRLVDPTSGRVIGDFSDPTKLSVIEGQGGQYSFNPQTGEIQDLRIGNKPRSAGVTVNTGNAPSDRPIVGKPAQDTMFRYDPETNSYTGEIIPGTETARDRESLALKSATTRQLADQQFNTVAESIDKAIEMADGWSAGLMGQIGQNIGSTPARNLRAALETVMANIGFEKLQEMRESSPTGGALGNVTERELAFLQSVRGSLDQLQSPAQLRETLEKVKQSLTEIHNIRQFHSFTSATNSGNRAPTGDLREAPKNDFVYNPETGGFE
ncbi:MAG: hypothetical protein AAGJ50_01520, partial [Pseudomonadota bacterium]